MKRVNDLTREELVALDDAGIQRMVDLEIASDGIKFIPKPTYREVPVVVLEPTIQGYEIHGLIFLDEEDAKTVAGLAVKMESSCYDISYDYCYLAEREGAVKSVMHHTKQAIKLQGEKIKEAKEAKKYNDALLSEYDEFTKATRDCRDRVWILVREAKDFFANINLAKKAYANYLKLSEGNKDIADNFFKSAYGVTYGQFLEGKTEESDSDGDT